MERALEMHKSGLATMIPIIVRQCDWNAPPLSDIQALPKDADPITKWENEDDAWFNVVEGLKKVISNKEKTIKNKKTITKNDVSADK